MTNPTKAPAFQFYAAEFLSDENVVLMTNQEVGCYIKLMAYCWREGSIPADVAKVARLCGENSSAMAQLWVAIGSCFAESEADPTRLVHPRLEKERRKQEEHKAERAASGKKGAEARWHKAQGDLSGIDGSAMGEPLAKDASSSSSSTASKSSSTTSQKTGRAASPRFDAQAHLVALGVEKSIARDWLRVRKAKSAAPTETAFDLAAGEAAKAGLTLNDALRICVEMSWAGFKASWVDEEGKPHERFRSGGGTASAKDPNVVPGWWTSDELALKQAALVGVAGPHPSDTRDSFHGRIRAAIENGGKPPEVAPTQVPKPAVVEPPREEMTEEQKAANRARLHAALKGVGVKVAGGAISME